MKLSGKSFDPINRTYNVVEVLHTSNKTNEEHLEELRKENPRVKIDKIKKDGTRISITK